MFILFFQNMYYPFSGQSIRTLLQLQHSSSALATCHQDKVAIV
jgi:hypothetical protein